jgi:phenylacetic acid degradation operon negative regulatory protein
MLVINNNMRQKEFKKIAVNLTDGLLHTATDTVLFTCFLVLCSAEKSKSSVSVYRTFEEAEAWLKDFNYDTIKRAIVQLKTKKFISYQRNHTKETLQITKEGKERLLELLPQYKLRRTWDKRIYLVTYDVPESQKRHRELLRSYIKRLGATMLQESVWIIPYNPREVLRTFIEEHNLSGVVIVSDMGKDAVIGEIDIKTLIRSLYKLDELNERYRDFIYVYGKVKRPNPFGVTKYLSILHDDPQLPFELLPEDWLGDKAYVLYQRLYGSIHL